MAHNWLNWLIIGSQRKCSDKFLRPLSEIEKFRIRQNQLFESDFDKEFKIIK